MTTDSNRDFFIQLRKQWAECPQVKQYLQFVKDSKYPVRVFRQGDVSVPKGAGFVELCWQGTDPFSRFEAAKFPERHMGIMLWRGVGAFHEDLHELVVALKGRVQEGQEIQLVFQNMPTCLSADNPEAQEVGFVIYATVAVIFAPETGLAKPAPWLDFMWFGGGSLEATRKEAMTSEGRIQAAKDLTAGLPALLQLTDLPVWTVEEEGRCTNLTS